MTDPHRLPAGVWVAGPPRSSAGFAIEHDGTVVRGRFAAFGARLDVGPDGAAHLTGAARAASAALAEPGLTALARGEALLDSARHPEVRFVSDAVRRAGDLVEVDGALTIRATTLAVAASGTVAEVGDGDGGLRLELATRLDRRQFGLAGDGGARLGTEVRLEVVLALVAA